MAARTSKKSALSSDINVTPMADVMLVLLVIFMLATPILQKDVLVNLPQARNPLESEKGPVVLALNREGRIFFDKKPVTEQEMIKAIQERIANEANKAIFLKADQALSYGKIVKIVDQCHGIGVERVGLITEKELPARF